MVTLCSSGHEVNARLGVYYDRVHAHQHHSVRHCDEGAHAPGRVLLGVHDLYAGRLNDHPMFHNDGSHTLLKYDSILQSRYCVGDGVYPVRVFNRCTGGASLLLRRELVRVVRSGIHRTCHVLDYLQDAIWKTLHS